MRRNPQRRSNTYRKKAPVSKINWNKMSQIKNACIINEFNATKWYDYLKSRTTMLTVPILNIPKWIWLIVEWNSFMRVQICLLCCIVQPIVLKSDGNLIMYAIPERVTKQTARPTSRGVHGLPLEVVSKLEVVTSPGRSWPAAASSLQRWMRSTSSGSTTDTSLTSDRVPDFYGTHHNFYVFDFFSQPP